MLAPQTLVTATLVTIAEPEDPPFRFVECAVCREYFGDGDQAYTIGEFPGAYLHTGCI